MAKNNELHLEITVDDNGSPQVKRFGDNVDRVTKTGSDGFGKMDSSLGDFTASAVKAVGVVTSVAAGVTALAAGVSALVVGSANEVRELGNLARLARTSTQELAAMAYATQKVGINADQLADISKDVQDKLGDFIATGGGEFLDFFENIAPKVGLTAQELQKLSGPDVLIAVKKAMDDANVSYAEQVFYLEAIGNDASKLIPLLANNGEELRKNAVQARELGLALSEVDEQKLLDAKEATDELTSAMGGLKTQIAAELAPAYTEFVNDAVSLTIGWKEEIVTLTGTWSNFLLSWKDVLSGKLSLGSFAGMDVEGLKAWVQDGRQVIGEIDRQVSELVEQRNDIRYSVYDGGESSRAAKAAIDAEIAALKTEKQEVIDLVAAKKEMARAANSSSGHAVISDGGAAQVAKSNAKAANDYVDSWAQAYTAKSELQSRALGVMVDKEEAALKDVERLAKEAENAARESAQKQKELVAASLAAAKADKFIDSWELAYRDRDEVHSRYLDIMVANEENSMSDMKNAVTGWASSFSGTLTEMVTGADVSFSGILHSFSNMIIQMMIQKLFVEKMMSGLSSGTGILGSIGGFLGLTANAQGGVYDSPSLSSYRNQVVSQPTFFAFASGGVPSLGVAGEVPGKKEGILPLATTSTGNLGVEAIFSGGGGSDSETKGLLRELIGAVKGQGNVRVINAIDSSSIVNAMSGAEGERMILNTITKNPSVIRRTASGG